MPEASKSATTTDTAFTAPRMLLLLGFLMFISYPGVFLGSQAFNYRDAGIFSYPLAYYAKNSLLHGEFPFWDPYNCCGIPFFAQWNTMVAYPFSFLFVLLPMPWSLNYFILLHVFVAAIGMYHLAFRWFGNRLAATLAGLVFAWNGASMDMLMWPATIAAFAWMPSVVLLTEKAIERGGREVFWAALAGACQMLAGMPEAVICTWFIIVVLSAARALANRHEASRLGLRLAAVLALVTGLSAIQLLPWADFVLHSDRSSSFGGDRWSLPATGIANFLVPLFHERPSVAGVFWQPGQEYLSSYYVGIATFALALVASAKSRDRKTLILAGIAVFGLLWAFGDAGLIQPALRKLMPLIGFVRYPAKYLLITLFCLPLLAASGLTWLQNKNNNGRRPVIAVGAILAMAIIGIVAAARCFPMAGEQWASTFQSGWTRLAFLLITVFVLARRTTGALAGFGLLLLIGADITTHAPSQNPTVPIEAYDHIAPPMSAIPRLGQSRAMVTPEVHQVMDHLANPSALQLYLGRRNDLFSDCNLLEMIPKTDGFFPLYLRMESKVISLFDNNPQAEPLMDFLGVSQVTSINKLFSWEARTNFMPLATIGQGPVFLDDAATLKALAAPGFLPREVAYLPPEMRNCVTAQADPGAKVISSVITPSSCRFETEAGRATLLVLSQSYYHCWKADIDGKEAKILRANFGFQAVEVPAGRHVVQFLYRDILFDVGAGATLVSAVIGLSGLWWRKNSGMQRTG